MDVTDDEPGEAILQSLEGMEVETEVYDTMLIWQMSLMNRH